jgi:AcrR family transcriptional regulator
VNTPANRRVQAGTRRQPNRRGNGSQLRDDLVAAAIEMIEAQPMEPPTLRGLARRVGIAATSVYLHFPDVDHVLAAVVERGFDQLTVATTTAAADINDPLQELRTRCRTYCRYGLGHPNLYRVMFQADLPTATITPDPTTTPGRRSFENLVAAVTRCLDSGAAPPNDDPVRLATLIWTAEHGIVLARISRPTFPWPPLEELVDDMVNHMMTVTTAPTRVKSASRRRRPTPSLGSRRRAPARSRSSACGDLPGRHW